MSSQTGDRRRLGTAAWADPEWVAATYPYRDDSVWLGRLPNGTAAGYADDRHVCLVSGNRGGKGTTSIIPTLCLWPGSVVVIDPKGENATVTAPRRGAGAEGCEGLGQAVHVLDPFKAATVDDALRSRFNPFDALDARSEESIDEAARLADALVVIHEDSKDPFWDESARAMLKGLILHILTAEEFEGRRNLVTLRKLVTRGDWEAVEVLSESGEQDIPPAQGLLWTGVQRNPAFNGIIAGIGDTFRSMFLNSPKQFESVLQVANRNTEFLDSPAMQRCVEASDFKLSDLKTKPEGLSLYLSLPQRYMNTHYRWLRMMIALVVSEMEIVKGRPATGHRVLVVLDEFAGLKRMEVIEHAVAQIAGYGVKLFFVLQSLEQLKATYKDNWETFLSNAALKIFFSLDDHFSREYVSKLIGETEVIRDVSTRSDSVSFSRSTSQSTSVSQSESVGTSSSYSRSESEGTNSSISRSQSENLTWGGGWFYTGTPQSKSRGASVSTSQGTSRGTSQTWTEGSSRTHGTTSGETYGISDTRGESQSAGTSETVHRRALIAPDEIGQMFARVDDRHDARFPGLALVAISGQPPILLRRTNYYEDPQFIDRFVAHPDHPRRVAERVCIGSETLVPFLSVLGPFDVRAWAVKPGDVVVPGQPVAQTTWGGRTMTLRAPLPGRVDSVVSLKQTVDDKTILVPLEARLHPIVEHENGSFFGVSGIVDGTPESMIRKSNRLVTLRSYEKRALVDPLVDFVSVASELQAANLARVWDRKTQANLVALATGAVLLVLLLFAIFSSVTPGPLEGAPGLVLVGGVWLYRYYSKKAASIEKTSEEFGKLTVERHLVLPVLLDEDVPSRTSVRETRIPPAPKAVSSTVGL